MKQLLVLLALLLIIPTTLAGKRHSQPIDAMVFGSLIHVGGGGRIYRSDASGLILKLDDFGNVNVYHGGVEMGQGEQGAGALAEAQVPGEQGLQAQACEHAAVAGIGRPVGGDHAPGGAGGAALGDQGRGRGHEAAQQDGAPGRRRQGRRRRRGAPRVGIHRRGRARIRPA